MRGIKCKILTTCNLFKASDDTMIIYTHDFYNIICFDVHHFLFFFFWLFCLVQMNETLFLERCLVLKYENVDMIWYKI